MVSLTGWMKTLSEARKSILKVVLFFVAFWLILLGLRMFPLAAIPGWSSLIWGGLIAVCSVFLVFLFLKSERKKFRDIGFNWEAGSFRRLLVGILCGMAVVGVMLLVVVIFSSVHIERISSPDYWNSIGYSALVLFVLAFMEEVVFRSYPLIRLSESVGIRASIYITSIFFAFYHGLNPSNLLGPGVWGLFFGLAAIKTNGIALATGFHFGLNWMQSFFGMKLQYASSIWTVTPVEGSGLFPIESVGLGLQIILFAIGVVLIELHVRQDSNLQVQERHSFAA